METTDAKDLTTRPETITQAGDLMGYFWQTTAHNLDSFLPPGADTDPIKTNLARTLIPKWMELTSELVGNPKGLHFCKIDIKKDDTHHALTLPEELKTLFIPEKQKGPDSLPVVPLKFSCLEAMVDRFPPVRGRLLYPNSLEQAAPQVQLRIRELYKDSEREVGLNIQAMQEVSQSGTWHDRQIPLEDTLKVKEAIRQLMEQNQRIITTQISVMGLVSFFSPAYRRILCVPLLGFSITERKFAEESMVPFETKTSLNLSADKTTHFTYPDLPVSLKIFANPAPWQDLDRKASQLIALSQKLTRTE